MTQRLSLMNIYDGLFVGVMTDLEEKMIRAQVSSQACCLVITKALKLNI